MWFGKHVMAGGTVGLWAQALSPTLHLAGIGLCSLGPWAHCTGMPLASPGGSREHGGVTALSQIIQVEATGSWAEWVRPGRGVNGPHPRVRESHLRETARPLLPRGRGPARPSPPWSCGWRKPGRPRQCGGAHGALPSVWSGLGAGHSCLEPPVSSAAQSALQAPGDVRDGHQVLRRGVHRPDDHHHAAGPRWGPSQHPATGGLRLPAVGRSLEGGDRVRRAAVPVPNGEGSGAPGPDVASGRRAFGGLVRGLSRTPPPTDDNMECVDSERRPHFPQFSYSASGTA